MVRVSRCTGSVKKVEVRTGPVRADQVRIGQNMLRHFKSSQVCSSQVNTGQGNLEHVKSSQVKSS